MKRYALLLAGLLIGLFVSAQGFPEAQKQPKMKESKKNHKNYAKQAHRGHHHMTHASGPPPRGTKRRG